MISMGNNFLTAKSSDLEVMLQSIGTDKVLSVVEESLSLWLLPEDWSFDQIHRLKSFLLVQIRTSRNGVLATTFLEAEEYGWGETEEEAIRDLASALIEYMESLITRRGN
ncbi:MAG: hypothetical protein EXR47_08350 [Dehalococcoidia bacterium]|nr:hypothetical protein [Dehalococcoidia bacterium]